MNFILKKNNVERIVDTNEAKEDLISLGYHLLEPKDEPSKENGFSSKKINELRKIAEEKGIAGCNDMKKEELVSILTEISEE